MGWGFGVLLLLAADTAADPRQPLLLVTAVVFGISGALALFFTRGRHLSWVVFFAIAVLALVELALVEP